MTRDNYLINLISITQTEFEATKRDLSSNLESNQKAKTCFDSSLDF
jgi:hypothetical protein